MKSSPSNADLRRLGERRHRLHRGQQTSRPLSPGYEAVGLFGERQFQWEFGFPMDLSDKPAGDGRVDFETPAGTVDVKTARKAFNLLREEGKPHAKILILAIFRDDTEETDLLGWEYDGAMRQCPVRDFGYGVINHYKHVLALRPMWQLARLLEW